MCAILRRFKKLLARLAIGGYNRRGSIFIQIFVNSGDGLKQADEMVEDVRQMFEGVEFAGVYAFDTLVREGPNDGNTFQVVTETTFFYEQTK